MTYTIRKREGWYVVHRGQVAAGPFRWGWLAEVVSFIYAGP